MAQLFGNKIMKEYILLISFLSGIPSNENTTCDLPARKVDVENKDWSVLAGCWHSFVCGENLTCLLCKEAINKKVEGLANVVKEANEFFLAIKLL